MRSLTIQNKTKRKDGKEVDDKPAVPDIIPPNFLQICYNFVGVLVNIALNKVEQKI